MPDVLRRNGRTLPEIAKAAVAGEPYTHEGDLLVADSWGGSGGPSGLSTRIGGMGEALCPGRRAGRWRITVLDKTTSECGVWDLRELRRELAAEARGIVQQQLF
jgi:hypothetical protein